MPRTFDPDAQAQARRPTLRDVAKEAGVSPMTASRILNGSASTSAVAEDTRTSVEAAAESLGYRPHAGARAMRRGRSGQIGLVVINRGGLLLTNLPAYEYILGLNVGLESAGLVLSMVRITDIDGHDPQRLRALREQLFDAFVVVGNVPDDIEAPLRALADERVIWLDTNVDNERGCLRRDEGFAGAEAANLLLARGRRRIVWLQRMQGDRSHFSHHAREAAVRERCRAADAELVTLDVDAGLRLQDPVAARRLLADPQVGLLAADPTITRVAQSILGGFGLVPGRDLGVASCDIDETLRVGWGQLSGIIVERANIGREAAGFVQDVLNDGILPVSRRLRSRVHEGTTA